MSSAVEICNLALSNIRAGSINSLTESSLQAQQCKLKYPIVRDMLLRTGPWSFARKIRPLTLTTDEIFNWVFAYQYPVDCLYVNRLMLEYEEVSANAGGTFYRVRYPDDTYPNDLDRQVKYDVINNGSNNKLIVSNDQNLRIDYRARIIDAQLFDSTFIMAFSHLLAAEVAIPVAGGEVGRELRKESLQIYQAYLNDAAASDMNESYVEPTESDFITVRR